MWINYFSLFSSLAAVIVSVITLVVTAIIGKRQIKQNQMTDEFVRTQSKKEEQKYYQDIDKQARAFVVKYNDVIGYLPLCFVASLYNNKYPYHRKMYTEFNLLTNDVQAEILKSQNVTIPKCNKNIWNSCYQALCWKLKKDYTEDYKRNQAFVYEGGKYLYRGIERYGKEQLTCVNIIEVENFITDTLVKQIQDHEITNAIATIIEEYDLCSIEEKKCCEILMCTMQYVSQYDNSKIDYEYWIPPYGYEKIETLEDLFLKMLLTIYVKLYLPYSETIEKGE